MDKKNNLLVIVGVLIIGLFVGYFLGQNNIRGSNQDASTIRTKTQTSKSTDPIVPLRQFLCPSLSGSGPGIIIEHPSNQQTIVWGGVSCTALSGQ